MLYVAITEKLGKKERDKIQKNYKKILDHIKVKRIEAALVSAFVIDFDVKDQWKRIQSERDVADEFVRILLAGTVEQCQKAKEVLKADDQWRIP